jgi:hypothetical protein
VFPECDDEVGLMSEAQLTMSLNTGRYSLVVVERNIVLYLVIQDR